MPKLGDKPRKGDRVWYGPERGPDKQPNGYIVWLSQDDVRVKFHDSRSLTIDVSEFYGQWTDHYQGCWLIEEVR